MKFGPTSAPKDPKLLVVWLDIKKFFHRSHIIKTLVGGKLIRNVDVRKASSQNLSGMGAFASNA